MEAVIVFLKPRHATDAVGLGIQATGVCARNSTRAAAERVLVVRLPSSSTFVSVGTERRVIPIGPCPTSLYIYTVLVVARHSYREQRELVCLHLNARSPCAAVVACHDGVSASSIRHGLISIPIPFRPSGPCRRAVFVVPIEQRTIATGLDA